MAGECPLVAGDCTSFETYAHATRKLRRHFRLYESANHDTSRPQSTSNLRRTARQRFVRAPLLLPRPGVVRQGQRLHGEHRQQPRPRPRGRPRLRKRRGCAVAGRAGLGSGGAGHLPHRPRRRPCRGGAAEPGLCDLHRGGARSVEAGARVRGPRDRKPLLVLGRPEPRRDPAKGRDRAPPRRAPGHCLPSRTAAPGRRTTPQR